MFQMSPSFQLWLFTEEGQMKTDEHLCLSAYQPVQGPRNWKMQLKECGQYESEYWDYNFDVSLLNTIFT